MRLKGPPSRVVSCRAPASDLGSVRTSQHPKPASGSHVCRAASATWPPGAGAGDGSNGDSEPAGKGQRFRPSGPRKV